MLRRIKADTGWQAWAENGLLMLDPGHALWQELVRLAPRTPRTAPERYGESAYLAAWALRLTAEAVAPDRQPVAPLRETLKSLEAADLARLENELPPMIAVLQHHHEPLPEAAGHYILHVLEAKNGGRTSC